MNLKIFFLILSLNLAGMKPLFAKLKPYGLFVEPGVTYEIGNSEINYPVPFSNSSGESNGFGLMGRFGMHFSETLFAAIDGRFKMVQFQDSTNNYNSEATGYDVAPVIGVQMPDIGLRIWGSYVLAGMLDPRESNSLDLKFEEATGPRVGAGFRLMSISINLEYQNLNYGKTTLEQLGPFASAGDSNSIQLKNVSYTLSVSFPLEI